MESLADKIQQAEAFICEVLAAVRRFDSDRGLHYSKTPQMKVCGVFLCALENLHRVRISPPLCRAEWLSLCRQRLGLVLNGVRRISSRFYRNRNAEELPSAITDNTAIHRPLPELGPQAFVMYRDTQHMVVWILSDLRNVVIQVAPEISTGNLWIVADQHSVPFQVVPDTLNHVVCFLF